MDEGSEQIVRLVEMVENDEIIAEPESITADEEEFEKELDRIRTLARTKAVLMKSPSLPYVSNEKCTKLSLHIISEEDRKKKQFSIKMARANNFCESVYPLVREVHMLTLEKELELDQCEAMLAVRDRNWIKKAEIGDEDSTLLIWHKQLKVFQKCLLKYEKFVQESSSDEELEPDLTVLCIFNEYEQEGDIVESLCFGTRYRGVDLHVTVKEQCDELTIESNPFVDCDEALNHCFPLCIPIDLVIRRWVWDLMRQQLAPEERQIDQHNDSD